MKYAAPYGNPDPNAPYINGNPAAGIAGSIPPAKAFEAPMRELDSLILKSGISPSDGDLMQLIKGVRRQSLNFALDVSLTTNVVLVTLDPVLTEYTNGLIIRALIAHTSTGACTMNAGPGPVSIQRADGTPMQAGDLRLGAVMEFVYNTDHFQLLAPSLFDFSFFILSDITVLVGPGGGNDFATIPDFFDWLRSKWIFDTATVTVILESVQHPVYTRDVVISHPQATRVIIKGGTPNGIPQPSSFPLNGIGSRVTDAGTALTYLKTRYVTEIRFAVGFGFKITDGRQINLLKDVLITGPGSGTATGIYCEKGAGLNYENIAVHGFGGYGIVLLDRSFMSGVNAFVTFNSANGIGCSYNSSISTRGINCFFLCLYNASNGIELAHSSSCHLGLATLGDAELSENGAHGINNWGNSSYWGAKSRMRNNGQFGCVTVGAAAFMNGGAAQNNSGGGINASIGGSIDANSGLWISNGGSDASAQIGSVIYISASSYTNLSPTVNVDGNGNSMIVG